jgi:hypothetical protein
VTSGGDSRVRAWLACERLADGVVRGKVAYCQQGTCFSGTFGSYRIERIAGEAVADGLELVSEWNGAPAAPWGDGLTVNVRVQDGVAYLARYQDGLRIVDLADPADPADLGHSPVERPEDFELYNDVKMVDGPTGTRYALMASNRRGIVVVDVSDPASPVEVTTFPPPPDGQDEIGVHTLFTEKIGTTTRAYLADTTYVGLGIFDVTDPANPVQLGYWIHPEVAVNYGAYLHDLYVEQGRAYLNYWDLGLVVVDTLADPANASLVGRYDDYERRTNHSNWVTTAGGRKVSIIGDEDFGAHLRVIDVADGSPTFMRMIGELQLRPEVSIHNIMAFGDKAYVAWYQDGLRIVDLSDPTQPFVSAYYNTWDGRVGESFYEAAIGLDLDLGAGLIYLADTARGLLVLREIP